MRCLPPPHRRSPGFGDPGPVKRALNTVHGTLCSVQCTLYITQCTVCSVLCSAQASPPPSLSLGRAPLRRLQCSAVQCREKGAVQCCTLLPHCARQSCKETYLTFVTAVQRANILQAVERYTILQYSATPYCSRALHHTAVVRYTILQ